MLCSCSTRLMTIGHINCVRTGFFVMLMVTAGYSPNAAFATFGSYAVCPYHIMRRWRRTIAHHSYVAQIHGVTVGNADNPARRHPVHCADARRFRHTPFVCRPVDCQSAPPYWPTVAPRTAFTSTPLYRPCAPHPARPSPRPGPPMVFTSRVPSTRLSSVSRLFATRPTHAHRSADFCCTRIG